MSNPVLSRLVLQRFRSLRSEQVEFDNPTFLVGQNGSGKSNFADAFALLGEAMISPLQAVLEYRGGFAAVAHRSSARGRPSNLGLAVELRNPDPDTVQARYGFELRPLKGYGFEVVREQCVVKRSDGSRDWFDRSPSPKRSSMAWRSTVDSLDPVMEPSALALPMVAGDTRFQAVWRFLVGMQVYQIEPALIREMQDPDIGARLRTDGSNAASVLREIQRESPDAWQRILELLESIVPGTVGLQTRKLGNMLTLEFAQDWERSEPVKFEACNMSDGTLRVVGLLAAVFQHRTPSLLVIEEPEATIHPGALGAVLDLLRHAGRSMQVVVTTHSPDILDADWIEDRHLRITTCQQGATRVSQVSPATRAALGEHLMGAGELLRSNALTPATLFDQAPGQYRLFEEDLP